MAVFVPNHIEKQTIVAPPSKSYAQRILLAAAMAEHSIEIENVGDCDDVLAMLNVVTQLGAELRMNENKIYLSPRKHECNRTLNCGESGLGVRLTTSIASTFGGEFNINGEGSLLQRPLTDFTDFLPKMGVKVQLNNGFLPLRMNGKLKGGEYTVDGSLSSQYISGLLMALPLCEEDSILTVHNSKSTPYIDITLAILKQFGVVVEHQNYQRYEIKGNQKYHSIQNSISVEGDWSGAAFWVVYGLIKGEIFIDNLNPKSFQADKAILEVISQIGGRFSWKADGLVIHKSKQEHHPFDFDATHCPDLFPILVVLAASIKGISKIKGVHRLKHKESDRGAVLIKEFGKLGLKIEEENDTMIIHGDGTLNSGEIHANNDHRIAMSGAIASILTENGLTIIDEDSVSKSYPNFWKVLLNEC